MAIEKVAGKLCASGFWLYDGVVRHEIRIVASNYDRQYEISLELWNEYGGTGDIYDQPPEGPEPVGPSGWLFEVEPYGRGTFASLEEAKAWVDVQPWAPVTWES